METIYYTLQDYLTHTKGVAYILIVIILIGMLCFWNFLTGKDED
jgi:hypothetical protein